MCSTRTHSNLQLTREPSYIMCGIITKMHFVISYNHLKAYVCLGMSEATASILYWPTFVCQQQQWPSKPIIKWWNTAGQNLRQVVKLSSQEGVRQLLTQ